MNDAKNAKARIFCVDVLRGLDVFYLLVIHYAFLAPAVFRVWPLESTTARGPAAEDGGAIHGTRTERKG